MTASEPLLKIRFDGDALGAGRIPVSHLLRFLENFNKALQRTERVMRGVADSIRRGAPLQNTREEIALDLVLLTHGSPAAVLGFERRQTEPPLPSMDNGMDILENAITGLNIVQGGGDNQPMPAGFDAGVLAAWRDVGCLFRQGVSRIQFTMLRHGAPICGTYTYSGYERIQQRIQGPQTNIRTIEGRLLMADFKEHGTRCRVHPPIGDPVLCLFDEAMKDEVLDNMLHYVRIVGEAKEDAVTAKITSINIHDVQRLEDREQESADLLPRGTPISRGFWESPSLDELALSQNVKPMPDVRLLFGTWPGSANDGFEESIDELRHFGMAGGDAQ